MGPHVSGRRPSATAPHAHVASPEPEAMALKYPASAASAWCPNATVLLYSRRSLPFRILSSQQPGGHLPHHHHHQAMDLFPDGAFVRLESRVIGKYVHADGDWERVSLRPNGPVPSLNAVWRVEHWVSPDQGNTLVLLQNAAYGRYLSFSIRKAKTGHRGCRTTQLDRTEPHALNAYPWMWTVERLNPPDQDYVSLRYFTCYLRANGRYLPWNIRVTADVDPDAPRVTTMMHWTVHQVAASPVPQPLPVTLEYQGSDSGLLVPQPPRMIRHVRANDEGEFDQNHHNWPSFAFYSSSVIDLKNELRLLQDWNEDMAAYTLCMRPGSHGRLMPLVTDDLPSSTDSMNIVVFRTGSPAAAALVYPAPPPPPADAAAA